MQKRVHYLERLVSICPLKFELCFASVTGFWVLDYWGLLQWFYSQEAVYFIAKARF